MEVRERLPAAGVVPCPVWVFAPGRSLGEEQQLLGVLVKDKRVGEWWVPLEKSICKDYEEMRTSRKLLYRYIKGIFGYFYKGM